MTVVMPYQRVLRYRRGALLDILSAGKHRTAFRRDRLVWVDLRASVLDISPQEVTTADGVRVKVSASLRWRVSEPQAWHEVSADPIGLVYDAAKAVLRELAHGLPVSDLPTLQVDAVPEALTAAAHEVGLEIASFAVRDVIVPPELRRAAEALVTAQKDAQIRLEQARGEAASLRALANAAGVLEQHPLLATLRIAQTVGESGGTLTIEQPGR